MSFLEQGVFGSQLKELIEKYIESNLGEEYHTEKHKKYLTEKIRLFVADTLLEIRREESENKQDDWKKYRLWKNLPIDNEMVGIFNKIFIQMYDISLEDTHHCSMSRPCAKVPSYFDGGSHTCMKDLEFSWEEQNPYISTDLSHPFRWEPDHKSTLQNDWQKALSAEGTDLIIRVGEEKFTVHSQILFCRSRYFNTMLNSGFRESNVNEVEIQEQTASTIQIYLKFLYTQEVEFGERHSLEAMLSCVLFAKQNLEDSFLNGALHCLNQHLREKAITFDEFQKLTETAVYYEIEFLLDSCLFYVSRNESALDWIIDVVDEMNFDLFKRRAKEIGVGAISDELAKIAKYNRSIKRQKVETAPPQ